MTQHKHEHSPICQHRHYYKCPIQASSKISHQFPKRKLDVNTNPPIRSVRNNSLNISTLAQQKYLAKELQIWDDQNYVRDYYLNHQNKNGKSINILHLTQQHMATNNAYVISDIQRIKHLQNQKNRNNSIKKAKKRAISVFNSTLHTTREDAKQFRIATQKQMKKLYQTLDEISNNIIYGTKTKQIDRQKDYLASKTYLTPMYLSQLKIRNPKNTIDLLQQIRILLQKQKLKYQDQRILLDGNQSVSMSFSMQSGSQQSSDLSQSKISEISAVSTQASGQQQFINKFCDLKQLQKKWKKQTILQTKQLIRKMLTHKLLSRAQRTIITNRNKQNEIQNKLRLLTNADSKDLNKNKKNPRINKLKTPLVNQTQNKSIYESIRKQQQSTALQQTLNDDQMQIKKQFLKTGRFDHPALLYGKTNQYSRIFDKTIKSNLSIINSPLKSSKKSLNKRII